MSKRTIVLVVVNKQQFSVRSNIARVEEMLFFVIPRVDIVNADSILPTIEMNSIHKALDKLLDEKRFNSRCGQSKRRQTHFVGYVAASVQSLSETY